MKKELAIVLVSGGMDSLVTAAIASEKYELALLHIKYGQRTEKKELKAFGNIAAFYKVPAGCKVKRKLIVSFEHLKQIGGSSLTDAKMEIPDAAGEASEIPTTYVPFRNAHLLAVATSWAEVTGATKIFIGASEEDSAGYPDCRQDFYEAFNQAIQAGTKPQTHIDIITPLIRMKKADIVKKGIELGAPFALTWSCYRNGKKACGRCDSCARRLKGFKEAGFKDPVKYL